MFKVLEGTELKTGRNPLIFLYKKYSYSWQVNWQLAVLPVPVSKSHHDVQRCQEEYKVKETVAVHDSICLIICGILSRMLHICITSFTQYSNAIT